MCDYSRKPVKWQVGNFSKLIHADILIALRRIVAAGVGRMDERQTQITLLRHVPAILAVVHDRHAAGAVAHVGPLMALHLIEVLVAYTSFNGTQRDAVGDGIHIHAEDGEVGFQHGTL